MKSTPENKVKKQIVEVLKKHGTFNWCAAASPYGVAGVSDRLCLLPNGKFLAIEAKAPGKKPTPLQEKFLEDVQKNHGFAMVIDGEEGLELLDAFLKVGAYAD